MGAKTTPLAERKKILAAYKRGKSSIEKVAKRYGKKPGALNRWLALERKTGSPGPLPQGGARPNRRAASLTDKDCAFVKHFILKHPACSRKDLLAALNQQRQTLATLPSLVYALKKMGLVKKRDSKSTLPRPKSKGNINITKDNRDYNISQEKRQTRKERRYPSDMTDSEWEIVKDIFNNKTGRPPTNNRRDIIDAIFYIARSGCQWDMLPNDFPNYKTVNSCFCRWQKNGIWKQLCDTLRKKYRKQIGREEHPSAGSVDSQSTKTTEKGGLKDLMVTKK